MVVIVFVTDPRGPFPAQRTKRVTYSSRIFIKPSFLYTQVEPGETVATTKEEEWVSKKKTEVTNTKQIETRVKRQVVLEDGKVVEDSGPVVTSNTTEDTETHEHHQTELRKLGDDEDDQKALEGLPDGTIVEKSNWVAVANPDGVVREVKERRVVSREETEEVKETEDVQHLGDITDEQFLAAVRSGRSDLRQVLRSNEGGQALVSTGPRLIRDTSKSNKVIDTEDTRELSSVRPDGKIITETQRTTEHEEVNDDECPDDVPDQNYEKESSQRFKKTREQEDVDYIANGVNIGHEMRFKTETMEVERRGDGMDEVDFDSLSARVRRRTSNIRQQPHRYRGISEWSERQERHHQEHYAKERRSPLPYHRSPSPVIDNHRRFSPAPDYRHHQQSPVPDYLPRHSPVPDYRAHSPTPDYGRGIRRSPKRDVVTPTPPQRKRTNDRQRQRVVEERTRYDSGYRSRRDDSRERIEEPPPDYSPPSPPPMPSEKKPMQKTRFAADPPKAKSGNIIGQSIRKLVGKIRSASAERKAKQRAKRSPSPSYQQGHVIDSNIGHTMERQPVQRYYLGEDPFGGSIYGRENKYEGVKPARSSRKPREEDRRSALLHNKVHRSQSTLGRFSKSTGRLVNASIEERNSQTLPRHLSSKHEVPTRLEKSNRSNSTINVSIINTVSTPRIVNDGPAKPARTYKSNLSRSKSLNVHAEDLNSRNMYTSNPQVHRLDEKPIGLKSPGLISSLNRSPDVSEEVYTSRFSTTRNGTSETADNKRVFMSTLKDRAPELFKTLHETETDSWKPQTYKTITTTTSSRNYNGDIYEPPTRLRDTQVFSSPQHSVIRRGSNSSTDFSETYHTTTRNDDPNRPSVTNTTTSVSKKTIPSKDGRSMETIESKETRSVTKSHYRGGNEPIKFYETERRYSSSGSNPVVIEVRNYRK
ncbi:uncharacterized protein LOC109609306 isoform X4 [Aethina tumida]|uniref:uncharacterized protein LOC109609306 isoform X4 n=1 Tax=Aethina tumida TaxID=116153 RepID=UPI002147A638|nr:uncharacterized protein LOC109609306 isoform X4 [Aethina tumida]